MQHSQDITRILQSFEGCELKAYHGTLDPDGLYTIGYGHTTNVYKGMTCTIAQVYQWLNEDLVSSDYFINKLVDVELNQPEFDALSDFVFNLGCVRFQQSTLLKLLNNGDFEGASNELLKWDMAAGKHCAGLLKRRTVEKSLFDQGIAEQKAHA